MRHRVYARFMGKVALVQVCDSRKAGEVTLRMRNRYRRHRVEFLHSAENLKTDIRWDTIKECLDDTVADTYLRDR